MRKFLALGLATWLGLTALPASAALDPDATTVFITGANRGIGLEFVNQMAAIGWNVIATARSPEKADDLNAIAAENERVIVEQLDVTDYDRMATLAEKYRDQPIDILLSNAGLTPRYGSAFRKVSGVDFEKAEQSMRVNAIAPLKLAQLFMDHVEASDQKKIVVISSKAGSFELSPKMPMMYSYRASKTALNMYMYTLSFETAKKDIIVTLISPGTVNTTKIPGLKPLPGSIEPQESVRKMLTVIDGLAPEHNGKFLDYEDGRVLDW